MKNLPIMRKATAVWLVDNTTLSFKQIADFCGMHDLEIQSIADGEVASGIKGFDPVANNQLTADEIKRCEADPKAKLNLKTIPEATGERKRKGPRYTPIARRQDKPSAIAWLVKHHPELSDGQIGKLVGTTKPTIKAIRERFHWNINNIVPADPVTLGLCLQLELDDAIEKVNKKSGVVYEGEEVGFGETIVSVDESLGLETPDVDLGGIMGPADDGEADDVFDPESFFKK